MDTAQLHAKIDAFVEHNKESLIEDLKTLIAVDSVEGPAAPGAPFGTGPRQALDAALAIARRLGLAAHEGEGYVGWAEVEGESGEYFATVTHLDVVPPGEGWETSPWELQLRDGWLIGRGVEDDKGPGVLCLYAAKFLLDNLPKPPHGVRVLLGCNEETGMADIPFYLAHNKAPLFAFSPDTDFPLCNGEKGHFGGELVSPALPGSIAGIGGGVAVNVIPDRAWALVRANAKGLPNTEWVSVSEQEGLARLDARGVGGHAAHPEGTVNAIGQLVDYLLQNELCEGAQREYLQLLQKLHSATDGAGVGIAARDESGAFTPLTIIGGTIEMRDGRIVQSMDSRFPPSITADGIAAPLRALARQHGAQLNVGRCAEPFLVPADSAPIRALMAAYEGASGEQCATYTMGGGTYARHFQNAVSFGPHDPAETPPAFVGPIHGANEGISLASMLRALKVYILALWNLEHIEGDL